MHIKFLIFLTMGTLLVAAIYSSSLSVVFGGTSTSCTQSDKTHTSCVVNDVDAAGKYTSSFFDCTYHKSSKTWSCVEAAPGPSSVPPGLKNAIADAKSNAISAGAATGGNENNTNNLEGNVL